MFGSVLDDVFGVLRPTDVDRIRALGSRGSIDLGAGRRLDTLHAPGHASHHIGLVDTVTGGGFTIKNPNAKSTCGCGSSFSV